MKYLAYLFVFLISISFVFAADVAYILENNRPLQPALQIALNDIGVSFDVIRDSEIPFTDFSQYSLVLIVEDVDKRSFIPFDEINALFFDERIAEEVWSGAEASLTSAARDIKVTIADDEIFDVLSIPPNGEIDVYSASGSEMHFLRITPNFVDILAVRTSGSTRPVIAKTIQNINGNVVKDLFFGVIKPEDWNINANNIFKNSIIWMLSEVDQDGDGWLFQDDCNDSDPTIHPGAQELIDDIDQNCVNDVPILLGNIPDLNWDEDTQEVLDLGLYLVDPDGDDVEYTSTSLNNINVNINGDLVTFTPNPDWFGQEIIRFTITDGEFGIDSNWVNLEVIDTFDPDLFAPVITLMEPVDGFFSESDDVTLKFSASDPTDDVFTCRLFSDVFGEWEPFEEEILVAS